jgi:hypothetical protein
MERQLEDIRATKRDRGEIPGVVANREADLACRITHMNKALLA